MEGVEIKNRVLYIDKGTVITEEDIEKEIQNLLPQFDHLVMRKGDSQILLWSATNMGETLVIPEGVTSFRSKYATRRDIKKVILPKSISPDMLSFDLRLFFPNLTELDLSNMEDLEGYTFQNPNMKKVILNPKTKVLPSMLFNGCISLEEIELPDSLEKIGNIAFYNCINLKRLTLPSGLKELGSNPFLGSGIEELYIPDGVNTETLEIGWNSCPKLKLLSIPNCGKLYTFGFYAGLDTLIVRNAPETFPFDEAVNSMTYYAPLPSGGLVVSKEPISGLKNYNLKPMALAEFDLNDAFNLQQMGYSVQDSINIVKNLLPSESFSAEDKEKMKYQAREAHYLLDCLYNAFSVEELKSKDMRKLLTPKFLKFYFQTLEEFDKQAEKTGLTADEDALDMAKVSFIVTYSIFGGFETEPFKEKKTSKSGKEIEVTTNYAQKTGEFFKEKIASGEIPLTTMVQFLESMDGFEAKFNPKFVDFVLNKDNFKALMEEERRVSGFIAKCCLIFDEFMEFNTSNKGSQRQLAPTVEKIKTYLNSRFQTDNPDLKKLVETVNYYFIDAESFDYAFEIRDEFNNNHTPKSIIKKRIVNSKVSDRIEQYAQQIESDAAQIASMLIDIANENYSDYSYELLDKDDSTNYILGKLCSCCSHLQGVGYGIMHASIVHPDVQNIVIRNKNGRIVAKSTLYINREGQYGVCNNVEIWSGVPLKDKDIIYDRFKQCVKTIAEIYNEENPDRPLKQINVGMGSNDLDAQIKSHDEFSAVLTPIDYSEYGRDGYSHAGDSRYCQYCIWKNELTGGVEV